MSGVRVPLRPFKALSQLQAEADRSRQTQGIPWVFLFHRRKSSRHYGTIQAPASRPLWLPLWLISRNGSSTVSPLSDRDLLGRPSNNVPLRLLRYVRRLKQRYEKGPIERDPSQRTTENSAICSTSSTHRFAFACRHGSGDSDGLGRSDHFRCNRATIRPHTGRG